MKIHSMTKTYDNKHLINSLCQLYFELKIEINLNVQCCLLEESSSIIRKSNFDLKKKIVFFF